MKIISESLNLSICLLLIFETSSSWHCSDEPNAESECETAINKAIETDGENPEAYQLKASFYLSKDNKKVGMNDWVHDVRNVTY